MPTRLLHPTHTTYRTHPAAWPTVAGTLLHSPYPNDTYPTGAKAETQTGFAKSWQRGASGFAAHCTSHRSTVHRATQRTAFDTRPARHARRHIFHQETCPAAPYTRKYSRTAFAPPAHTHENASKDTYPACLYTERALPSHIPLAYSPRPNHSSISRKQEKSKNTRLCTCHQGAERHTKESKRIFCAMFLQKVAIKFCRNIKSYYLCTRKTETRLAKRGKTLQEAHWTLSSAGSERLPYKQRVGGSNPSASTGNTMEWLLSSTE